MGSSGAACGSRRSGLGEGRATDAPCRPHVYTYSETHQNRGGFRVLSPPCHCPGGTALPPAACPPQSAVPDPRAERLTLLPWLCVFWPAGPAEGPHSPFRRVLCPRPPAFCPRSHGSAYTHPSPRSHTPVPSPIQVPRKWSWPPSRAPLLRGHLLSSPSSTPAPNRCPLQPAGTSLFLQTLALTTQGTQAGPSVRGLSVGGSLQQPGCLPSLQGLCLSC